MIKINDESYMNELEVYESSIFDKYTRDEVFLYNNTPIDYDDPDKTFNLFIHYCNDNDTYYTYEGGYETYKEALQGLLDILFKI